MKQFNFKSRGLVKLILEKDRMIVMDNHKIIGFSKELTLNFSNEKVSEKTKEIDVFYRRLVSVSETLLRLEHIIILLDCYSASVKENMKYILYANCFIDSYYIFAKSLYDKIVALLLVIIKTENKRICLPEEVKYKELRSLFKSSNEPLKSSLEEALRKLFMYLKEVRDIRNTTLHDNFIADYSQRELEVYSCLGVGQKLDSKLYDDLTCSSLPKLFDQEGAKRIIRNRSRKEFCDDEAEQRDNEFKEKKIKQFCEISKKLDLFIIDILEVVKKTEYYKTISLHQKSKVTG